MSGKFGSVKVHILFKLFLFSILTTILNYIFQQKWRETEKKMATDQVKLMEFRFIIFFLLPIGIMPGIATNLVAISTVST